MPRINITPAGHASAGAVNLVALTGFGSEQVATAVRDGAGNLKVISWGVGSSGSLAREGDAGAGSISSLTMAAWPGGPGVVTAVRTSSGTLKLIAGRIDGTGAVQRRGDIDVGTGKEIAVTTPASFTGVATAIVNDVDDLEVAAWRLEQNGTFAPAGMGEGGACTLVTVAGLFPAPAASRVAVAVRTASGNLKIINWAIAGDAGSVTRIGEISAGPVDQIAMATYPTAHADIITTTRGPSGDLTVIGWAVANDGALTRVASATGGPVSNLAVTTWTPDVHSYVVGAIQGGSGPLKVITWRNGADLARHGEIVGEVATNVAIAPWAGGVITACRGGDGNLRLDSWALQPAGIWLLQAEWPPTLAGPPAAPSSPSSTEAVPPAEFVPVPASNLRRSYGQVMPRLARPEQDVSNG